MDTLLIFFLGASLGSFLGLVLDRFPEKSIIWPGSQCDNCGKALAIRDLIPILSEVANGFACRFCGEKLPVSYCLLELASGLAFWLGWTGLLSWTQVFLILVSLLLSLYDLKGQNYPLVIILLAGLTLFLLEGGNTPVLVLLLLGILAQILPLGIGEGDLYYLAFLALALDLYSLLWIIQLGSLLAILFIISRKEKRAVPFLPFLSLAYLLELVLLRMS
ncbi:prepilin peptidase [Streptococcus sobrinus]|uniref:Prepilin peptidase n=3 Tax=Streptococcus sobrinus TaxID=1310 RepID=A0ABM6W8A9_9STRE|nr:prepilin peptidase [Streptococcus sobrinus]AWN21303.1 prepilin peptidase [Streptococcus sobrinus]EMP72585.1 leader peptidase (prepilin peptidase) / N-methyltransferase [Streptococcus sobrinus DSM 20742 = ATCC 33478]OZV23067.1 prepilin peptidase [Streptococcus sobrinus]SQG14108.1 peptidase [Streptococcus sobrinus]